MWYVSFTGWEFVDGRQEPRYYIKHAALPDRFHWERSADVCIGYDAFAQAIGRPCVFRYGGEYRMLYSYRGIPGFRTNREQSYRLGYAESHDGLRWIRKDCLAGIERSANGWDSLMMEYCYFHRPPFGTYLFYNGNGLGQSGVGYALLVEE
jgi:hypothetical protein